MLKNQMSYQGIITLLTDFGEDDWYVGVMKGVISSINPSTKTIDICHNVRPHNIREGAFMLGVSYHYFPEGAVHLAVVDPGVGSKRRPIILKTQKYYFVTPDNGLLSYVVMKERVEKIVEITNDSFFLRPLSSTFHGRDVFAPVAAHLSKGVSMEEFGEEITDIFGLPIGEPFSLGDNKILGHISYVDRFGNLITDVPLDFIEGKIKITIGDKVIQSVYKSYLEGHKGEVFGIPGSSGYLEISAREASAEEVLGLSEGDEFYIEMVGKKKK